MSFARWFGVRRSAFVSIAIGSVSWAIAIAVAWMLWPDVAPLAASADRLAYASQLLVGVAVIVLLMVSMCFRVFDADGAEDPFAGVETPGWKIHQRVLSNTVEQALIFVPAIVALSVRVSPEHAKILPILTALWCAGRVLFWIGYRIKHSLRGPGFEWTLYSSMTAIIWFVTTL